MKRVLIIIYLSLSSLCFCQSWQPVGSAIQDTGIDGNSITTLCSFKSELYAGGEYDKRCPTNNIARWNGVKWDSLTSGTNSIGVLSLLPFDSLLFVGGQFTIAGGYTAQGIAQWDGTKWDTVGSGLDGGGGVYALCVYNGELYAGGQYNTTKYGRVLNGIAMWNGNYWDSLGTGLNGFVWSMAVYKGKLYVGGYFTTAGGIGANSIAVWDGTKWDSLGAGVGKSNSNVNALVVYNNKLYVGGDFTTAGGKPANAIATWDGTNWDTVGKGVNIEVASLTVYNGNLIAGGAFDSAGGKPAMQVAKWDGTKWSPLGQGLTSPSSHFWVLALGVYDSSLYAGGGFTKSGATTVMGIASWRDSVLLGENELTNTKQGVRIYPNPNNGKFTIAIANYELGCKNTVAIYNMLGEQVYQSSFIATNTQIDLSDKAKGIYLYRVVSEKGDFISEGKFIIE